MWRVRSLSIRQCVLMDEPFGALDAVTRNELHILMRRIRRDLRQTLLLVTHDIAEAAVLGTRIGVLDEGALIVVRHASGHLEQ